jgi:hypothetical protein
MLAPVCPFDQFTVQSLQTLPAVNVTLCPLHKLVLPPALRDGAEGAAPLVTATAFDATLTPQVLVFVAV